MKNTYFLDDAEWQLTRAPVGEKTPDWESALPARVPGNIVDDLHRAGLLPDPFYGENFRSCKWTELETFWYRRTLPALESEHGAVRLCFDGIDTFGEIFVNGHSLGTVHNMHRRWRFDLSGLLRGDGSDELVVRIDPPDAAAHVWAASVGVVPESVERPVFGYPERIYARKAQMSYGWDQTPCLLTGGIHRGVRLEFESGPVLEDFSWRVESLDLAHATATVVVEGAVPGGGGLMVALEAEGKSTEFAGEAAVDGDHFRIVCLVGKAEFWWPNGMGEPHLYECSLRLRKGDQVLDEQRLTIGLRTVRVITGPPETVLADYRIGKPDDQPADLDGGGVAHWRRVPLNPPEEVEKRPFRFEVNGCPVFIKGFNWMNPHALLGCVTEAQVRGQVRLAHATHANMLRLNGVATPEMDAFYDACDRCGLLVWQDFYYASALYPQTEGFLKEAAVEAADIVRRVRNHSCLALWCGDNEADMNLADRGLDAAAYALNRRVLPEVLRKLDSQGRFYHTSCPSGGPYPRSDWGGDKRNWGGWFPADNYYHTRQEAAAFVSEGGSYGMPSIESIRKFMPEVARWPLNSPTWRLHNGALDREDRRLWEITLKSMQAHSDFHSLEEAVEVSQFAHAWGSKLLIERCRQRQGDCGGVLLWKFNAVWPCCDGQYIDFYGEKLLGYDYVREAMKPVAVSLTQAFDSPDGDVEVYIANDLSDTVTSKLRTAVVEVGPNGDVRKIACEPTVDCEMAANSSRRVALLPVSDVDPDATAFLAMIDSPTAPVPRSVGLFSLRPGVAYRFMRTLSFDLEGLHALIEGTRAEPRNNSK